MKIDNMKRIFIYIIGLASIVHLSGCLDDKNDYNYRVINKLDGEIKNMDGNYSLASEEELTLAPVFSLTIDKENPDVSYEWLLDGKLLAEETGSSCTFQFERSGRYEITFSIVDNKTGVKFSKGCIVTVRSPFTRGWLVLSEGSNQESKLSFVGARTLKTPIKVIDSYTGQLVDAMRDSLVYGDQVIRDMLPGLGKHPIGLALNAGYASRYREVYDISDEVIVMQDRWAELNGKTLERSVYTDEEFKGDFPEAGFKPVSIAMTYSSKAMLNEDGYIYWANNSFADDFHACAYISDPLSNGQKFTGVYPSYKVNRDHAAIPACTGDNKIVGLMDAAAPKDYSNSALSESTINSNMYEVKLSNGDEDTRFRLGNKKIVTMMPASCYKDWTVANPGWVALLKEGTAYKLFYFMWKITSSLNPGVTVINDQCFEYSLPQLTGYTDMAVFNNKQYAVIANGADLWYFQYGTDKVATIMKLHTFNQPIKSLAANDVNYNISNQWAFNGQLGVALEDGSFWIYEVLQQKTTSNNSELATGASINQLFPDPKSEGPMDNKFGNVVDIIYKYGNVVDFMSFKH